MQSQYTKYLFVAVGALAIGLLGTRNSLQTLPPFLLLLAYTLMLSFRRDRLRSQGHSGYDRTVRGHDDTP